MIGHFIRASRPSFPRGGSYISFSLIYNTETPGSFVSGEVSAELERVWVILSTAQRSLPSGVAGGKGVPGFDEAGRKLDIAGGVVGGEVGEGGRKAGNSG